MTDLSQMVRRQQVLADFGELALGGDDLDRILTEACRLVADALGTRRAKVLEIRGEELLVRAGVGWTPDIVGRTLRLDDRSSESFSIQAREPVITNDIADEPRFDVPFFMRETGVVARASVPIILPGGGAYGLIQVDDVRPRKFDDDDVQFLRTYAAILGPVIDRVQKLGELRASRRRLDLIVEKTRDYAIFVLDDEGRITDWFSGAAAVFGWSAEEAVGRPAALLYTPEDLARREDVDELETARRDGSAPNVRWHLRKDGSRVFIEGSVRRLEHPGGGAPGFLKIGQDVTERRRRDEQLRQSEMRFREFGEASPDLIWIRDAETLQFEYVSPAFEAIYGEPREAVSAGDSLALWLELLHPDDRERARSQLENVRLGGRFTHEFRIVRRSDGEVRWIENTDFPLDDVTGRAVRVGGFAKDVTEAKAGAARLEVLVAELQHRSRNLLGVITAVATRTLPPGGSVEDFQVRLKALSRAQALLSRFGSDTVEVSALVRAELEAHGAVEPPRVTISGPKVHLTARQVQNYALALHELATNAVKYGALKSGEGRLAVSWSLERDRRDRPRLVLCWTETGVPVPADAGARRGYGRELIEEALTYALGAKTEFILGEDGVRCRIDLPLD